MIAYFFYFLAQTKPIHHFSGRTCDEYDDLRCDISTAFNLKRQLETLQKERDEFRSRFNQLKAVWLFFISILI